MLWLGMAAISIAVMALVLWPALRARVDADERTDYGLRVFKDQLDEIARDRAAGHFSEDQAAAARVEVERRLLAAAADRPPPPDKPIGARGARISAAAAVLALPALGFVLYLAVGQPDKPDQPLALRNLRHPDAQAGEIADMVERLRTRLQTEPGDIEGWMMLGRSYRVMGRLPESAEAYREAAQRSDGDPAALSAYGEALIYASDGVVTPPAQAAFSETLRKQAGDPRARFYLALARVQAGDVAGGLADWRALDADSPADAPWLTTLRERIAEATRMLNLDLARLPPLARAPQAPAMSPPVASAPPRGPSQADMQAAQGMAPQDRNAMIRGMVEGLAQRLEENPNDRDGWLRLARAWTVLGEAHKARVAEARAAGLTAPAPERVDALLDQARALFPADGNPDRVPPAFTALMRRILALDPEQPEALYHVGLAEAAAGNKPQARQLWTRLLAKSPPGSPGYAEVKRRLDGLGP
ncbi:MAG: c-type cytochrome biogenesis protein CcmI [Alphaproteobacteria bacterium]|nr:c-type cytochrome biogenesis protein CcmI [Alphaproteobacteria bacterium]